MTPDEFRIRSCTSKVQYAGRREARDNANRLMDARGGGRATAYRCHFAGGEHWHVGHGAPKSKGRRR